MDVKEELAKKAEHAKNETKLTRSMSIADLIKAMQPEIKKALPEVITPERFTRMALSALKQYAKTGRMRPDEFPCSPYERGPALGWNRIPH